MLEVVVWTYVGVSALLILWSISRRRDLETFPSLVWLILMGLPYAVQFDTFSEQGRTMQALGIIVVAVCLFIGDGVRPGIRPRLPASSSSTTGVLTDYRVYAVLFIVIATVHLYLLEHIPLIEKYVHQIRDTRALAVMREGTSKLLPVSDLVKYLFTWAITVLAPLTLVLMLYKRKYLVAVLFFLGALLYAALSLAKTPIVLLVAYLVAVLLSERPFRQRLYLYTAVALLALPFAWSAGKFLLWDPESIFNYVPPQDELKALALERDDPRAALTYGDRSRLKPLEHVDEMSTLERTYNSYTYRVFLGPSDVSSRWYQFFPSVSGGFINLQGLTPEDRKQASTHPARLVASWAYRERFPDKYLDTAQAYASVDADAYARYGLGGIIAAGIIVLAIRLLLRWLRTESLLTRILYMLGVVQLGLLLPIASLQAILFANGLLIIIGLMMMARYVQNFGTAQNPDVQAAYASSRTREMD